MQPTENALVVLEKRYFLPGENWDGLCKRVAKAVANGDENLEEKYFQAINNFYFLPNSPALLNAGTSIGNLSACFKEDAMVLVENGVKKISNINIGDNVLTHNGRYRRVTEVFERKYAGDMLKINVVGCIKNRFISTPEHPIYAIKRNDILCKRHISNNANMVCNHSKKVCKKTPKDYKYDCDGVEINPDWIAAKDLVVGDYVSISLLNSEDGTSVIDICDYLDMNVFSLDGDNVVIGNYRKNIVGRYILIDERFMRLYGYWLSDGHVTHNKKIGITFNSEKDEEYADDAVALIKDIFNYDAKKEFASDGQKTIQVRVHSKIIASFFENFSGHGFNGKFIPKIIMEQPKHLIEQLLIGQLRGDGFIFNNYVAMSYSNLNLITSTSILLNKIGINNALMRDYDSKLGTTPSYRLKFNLATNKEFSRKLKNNVNIIDSNSKQFLWNNGKLFRRISEIETETFSGIVYNIEVEEDHSYSVNGIDVHNCFVLGLSDSMESIMDTAKDMSIVFKSGGGVGIDISTLREEGAIVRETNGVASGAVSFMEIYNTVANVTKQGGKRRAALMGVMRVDHPEILDFIRVKNDRSKLNNFNLSVAVTDKFMRAAENGENYDLISPKNGKVGELNAREVFNLIAQNAWENGEPGLLFIDTINSFNPIPQFGKITCTNPCVHGDTLIAVADGRGSVPISQLAEEGLDVPVYCSNDNGNVCIKMMRNPRITGYNQKLLRVNIEDGLSIVVTENHKLKLNDGRYVEAKDLSAGDSLSIATIFDARMQDIFVGSNSKSQKYRWINDGKRKYNKSEHRMIYEFFNDCKIPSGSVIHHLDYNGLNNNIENLVCMTKSEHDNLHRQDKIGKNNPYFKMSPESLMRFKNAPRDGENNANFSGVSHDEIFNYAKLLTMELGKRFSKKEWIEYAERNNIPQSFSKYRKNVFVDIRTLSIMAAIECGLEHCDIDQRIVKTYNMAMKDGYNAKIENGTIVVSKICEMCGNSFDVPYSIRETSFCGRKCSCKYLQKKDIREVARISMIETYKDKLEITKSNQLDVFTRLRFELGRIPLKKEWESACRKANIPIRFGSKFGFSGYKELKHCGEFHNHRVISVVECGYGTVYTGTVDDFHNFYSTFESKIDGKSLCINNLQCGEIPLLRNEACNLLSVNLKKLNTFEEIETTVRLGVRFLNGVLDVSTFPTESITKQVAMTKKIGLGVMGWADYLAERMIPYDSNRARNIASELMANIKQWAHDESVKIANERNEYIETTMGKRRNGTLLCIAPTGTISMIADCSSSIEPYFALSYTKNVMDGESLKYINETLVNKLKDENLWCREVESQILKTGSIQHIDTIPDRIKRVFKTANEISIHGHIKMQAAFQEHVDNSISKTINMSSNATVDDVMLAYIEAYRLGVKGITIYRDGSRNGQVLTSPKARIEKCPECQSKSISHDSGCVTCQSCGWSICSI